MTKKQMEEITKRLDLCESLIASHADGNNRHIDASDANFEEVDRRLGALEDDRLVDTAKIVSIDGLSTEQAERVVDVMRLREKFAKQAEAKAYERGKKEERKLGLERETAAKAIGILIGRKDGIVIGQKQINKDEQCRLLAQEYKLGKAEGIAEGRELEKADVLRYMHEAGISYACHVRALIQSNSHRG